MYIHFAINKEPYINVKANAMFLISFVICMYFN